MIDDKKQAFAAAVQTAVLVMSKMNPLPHLEWIKIVADACMLDDAAFAELFRKNDGSISNTAYAWVTSLCGKWPEALCGGDQTAAGKYVAGLQKSLELTNNALNARTAEADANLKRAEKAEAEIKEAEKRFCIAQDIAVREERFTEEQRHRATAALKRAEKAEAALRETQERIAGIYAWQQRAEKAEEELALWHKDYGSLSQVAMREQTFLQKIGLLEQANERINVEREQEHRRVVAAEVKLNNLAGFRKAVEALWRSGGFMSNEPLQQSGTYKAGDIVKIKDSDLPWLIKSVEALGCSVENGSAKRAIGFEEILGLG